MTNPPRANTSYHTPIFVPKHHIIHGCSQRRRSSLVSLCSLVYSTDPSLGQISLLEHLDASQINCLNEERPHDLKSIFAAKKLNTSTDIYLESSADAQLLLSIHVRRPRALSLTCV